MKKLYPIGSEWILLLLVIAVAIAGTATAFAQSAPVVSVTSRPSGATVVLTGDYTVAGITPTSFSQSLQGLYRIRAHYDGYETYQSTVVLSGRDAVSLDIKLTPKTRLRAAARSLLIPGWGQQYVGHKTKGTLLTIATLGAAATTGVMYLRYESRRDDYDDFNALYHQTRSVEEREKMLTKLYSLQHDAYYAERDRNLAFGVLAGVWIYNLLDAVIFFPDYGMSVSGTSLGVYPDRDLGGFKVLGTWRF